MKRIRAVLGLAAAAAVAATSGAAAVQASAQPAARADGVTLTLAAYSTPRDAYAQLVPAFQATPAGQGISFSQSFGASGDQSRAVANGLPADVVNFSLTPDISTLVASRLVRRDWNHGQFRGMVTDSVVVIVVRKGNPKHIHDWSDLVKPGVSVITPNPFTSGGARWNVMAAYGAQLEARKTPAQAQAYLQKLFEHVAVQDKSARDALQTFLGGKGDAMLAYESEALPARAKGLPVQIVYPRNTILIENPIAVTSFSPHPNEANAFVAFLRSPQGQTIWAKTGYRPVLPSVLRRFKARFPTPKGLFRITDLGLGGWANVSARFFDPSGGIVAKIERSL